MYHHHPSFLPRFLYILKLYNLLKELLTWEGCMKYFWFFWSPVRRIDHQPLASSRICDHATKKRAKALGPRFKYNQSRPSLVTLIKGVVSATYHKKKVLAQHGLSCHINLASDHRAWTIALNFTRIPPKAGHSHSWVSCTDSWLIANKTTLDR